MLFVIIRQIQIAFIVQVYKYNSIKELRTASGMTQQAFSEYLHIPKRSIVNWETGQRNAPEYLIELIEYKLRKEGLI